MVSKQAQWQRSQKAKGLCTSCNRKLAPDSASFCRRCLARVRKRRGTKAWSVSGMGRPPLRAKRRAARSP